MDERRKQEIDSFDYKLLEEEQQKNAAKMKDLHAAAERLTSRVAKLTATIEDKSRLKAKIGKHHPGHRYQQTKHEVQSLTNGDNSTRPTDETQSYEPQKNGEKNNEKQKSSISRDILIENNTPKNTVNNSDIIPTRRIFIKRAWESPVIPESAIDEVDEYEMVQGENIEKQHLVSGIQNIRYQAKQRESVYQKKSIEKRMGEEIQLTNQVEPNEQRIVKIFSSTQTENKKDQLPYKPIYPQPTNTPTNEHTIPQNQYYKPQQAHTKSANPMIRIHQQTTATSQISHTPKKNEDFESLLAKEADTLNIINVVSRQQQQILQFKHERHQLKRNVEINFKNGIRIDPPKQSNTQPNTQSNQHPTDVQHKNQPDTQVHTNSSIEGLVENSSETPKEEEEKEGEKILPDSPSTALSPQTKKNILFDNLSDDQQKLDTTTDTILHSLEEDIFNEPELPSFPNQSTITQKPRFSPDALAKQLHQTITMLETTEQANVQITALEKAREVALAQQETVAVAKIVHGEAILKNTFKTTSNEGTLSNGYQPNLIPKPIKSLPLDTPTSPKSDINQSQDSIFEDNQIVEQLKQDLKKILQKKKREEKRLKQKMEEIKIRRAIEEAKLDLQRIVEKRKKLSEIDPTQLSDINIDLTPRSTVSEPNEENSIQDQYIQKYKEEYELIRSQLRTEQNSLSDITNYHPKQNNSIPIIHKNELICETYKQQPNIQSAPECYTEESKRVNPFIKTVYKDFQPPTSNYESMKAPQLLSRSEDFRELKTQEGAKEESSLTNPLFSKIIDIHSIDQSNLAPIIGMNQSFERETFVIDTPHKKPIVEPIFERASNTTIKQLNTSLEEPSENENPSNTSKTNESTTNCETNELLKKEEIERTLPHTDALQGISLVSHLNKDVAQLRTTIDISHNIPVKDDEIDAIIDSLHGTLLKNTIDKMSAILKKKKQIISKNSLPTNPPRHETKQSPSNVNVSLDYILRYSHHLLSKSHSQDFVLSTEPIPMLQLETYLEIEQTLQVSEEQQMINKMIFDCINEYILYYNKKISNNKDSQLFKGNIFGKKRIGSMMKEEKRQSLQEFIVEKITCAQNYSQTDMFHDFALLEMVDKSAGKSSLPILFKSWNSLSNEMEEVKTQLSDVIWDSLLQDTVVQVQRIEDRQLLAH